ncbi:hypothetical protein CGA21_26960 [Pseudomonas sp. PSB11]|nr:hypothetical protein [Pseudomonas sp. PSB11]
MQFRHIQLLFFVVVQNVQNTSCRSEHAPGGVPTKNLRAPRGVRLPALSLTSIASMLAPTGGRLVSIIDP